MNRHLNEQEVLEWVSGERTQRAEEHLHECAECRGEMERLGGALGGFRTSTREWAEAVRPDVAGRALRHSVFPGRRLRLATALAVLLICFGVLLTRRQIDGPVVQQTNLTDDAVLEQVNAAMSRDVPSAMEALSQLVPTEQKEKAGEAN